MTRTVIAALAAAALIAAASGAAAAAQVVELRSGQRVEGTLQHATSTSVTIDVGGRLLTFPADQVIAIRFSPPPAVRAAPSAAREALDALGGLRAILSEGATYGEYSARLDSVRPKVEHAGRDSTVPAEVTRGLDKAFRYYATAATVWEKSRQNRAGLMDDGAMAILHKDPCPELQSLDTRERGRVLSAVWMCAGDAMDEVEKLVNGR